MDILVDFMLTGGKLFSLGTELTECTGRLNMLNADIFINGEGR